MIPKMNIGTSTLVNVSIASIYSKLAAVSDAGGRFGRQNSVTTNGI